MISKEKSLKKLVKENLTIPNIISFIRILLIIPSSYFFIKEDYVAVAIVLMISGISDMFDGIIARKCNQITKLGSILDPIADKLTLISVVICMGLKFSDIYVFVVILAAKEILMLAAGTVLLKLNITPPAAKWYGKLGTIFFYFSIIIIVGLKACWGIRNSTLTTFLLLSTVSIMIFALIKYFMLFLQLISRSGQRN